MKWDKIGAFLSIACVIHCLFFPLLSATFLVWGMNIDDELTHRVFLLLITSTGLLAFIPGMRKHKDVKILSLALVGFSILSFIAFFGHGLLKHTEEIIINIIGSIILIIAHLLNHYKTKRVHCCGHED